MIGRSAKRFDLKRSGSGKRLLPGSSAVEQPAVNRLADGSNPSRGATYTSQPCSGVLRKPWISRRLAAKTFSGVLRCSQESSFRAGALRGHRWKFLGASSHVDRSSLPIGKTEGQTVQAGRRAGALPLRQPDGFQILPVEVPLGPQGKAARPRLISRAQPGGGPGSPGRGRPPAAGGESIRVSIAGSGRPLRKPQR